MSETLPRARARPPRRRDRPVSPPCSPSSPFSPRAAEVSGPGPSTADAPPAVCGNGVREAGEECDDGNVANARRLPDVTCQAPAAFVPSDVHVHSTGCSLYATPAEVAAQLKAQQIRVGAALVWGEGWANDRAFFTGRDHPLSTPDFLLHYDLEVSHFVAAKTGHLVLLGLDSIDFSSDVFYVPQSGVPVVDWARRQPRAVVGMAHAQFWPADGTFPVPPGGCCVPWEVVVARRPRPARLPLDRADARGGAGDVPASGRRCRTPACASRSPAAATGRASPTGSTSARRGPT